MATNTPQQPNIEEIRELLSPYLDGEVTAVERVQVDSALAGSLELQADLASLRQTVTLLANLPVMPAPRPFTLTAAQVQQPQRQRRFWLPAWAGGLAAAAAAIICVLVVGGGLFWGAQLSGSQSAPAQMVAQKEMAAEAVQITAAKAPAAPAVYATEPAAMKKSIEAQPTAVATAAVEEKAEAAAAAAPIAPPAAPITANQEMMLAQDAVGGAASAAPAAKSAPAAAPPALAVEVPAEGSVQLESAPMPEQENRAANPPAAAAVTATAVPTATARPTLTTLPTPTPAATATVTVTIAPTPVITAAAPAKEPPKTASAFNFLSLGGILLFFVLTLGVIAVYVFIKGKKQ